MSADVAACATTEDAAVLRCGACGARDPVRAPARIHGWQRCAHCGGINVAPWSRGEALDGPMARSVVVQRRGRAHFLVPRRTLFSTLEVSAWLFLILMIGGFCIGFFELQADPHGTWRWLGPLLLALLMGVLCALALRRWQGVQHLELSPRRMRVYRTVGARRLALAERSLRDRALQVEVRRGAWDDDSLVQRYRVELRAEGDERPPLVLVVQGEGEARWIEALARLAADPSRPAGTRCCGCGAPVPLTMTEHAAGHVACPFCRAGFVVAAQRLHWPRLDLPVPDATGARASGFVRASRRGAERRWELRPRHRAARLLHALGMLYGVGFFGGFAGFLFWVVPHMPQGTIGLRLYGICGGLMMLGMAGFIAVLIALSLFGRDEVVLDEATVRIASRVGSWRWARPGRLASGDPPGDARRPSTSVPILRLTGVELVRAGGSRTQLVLTTPNRRLVADWSLDPPGSRWLGREILEALAERLRALGREVRVS